VITDGNGRRGGGGHAAGARSVVRCVEHCRERGDVALFCALLLSPENVRRRGERFFATMHALFIRLVADVRRGRALAGVRCELYGSLDGLRRRGGAARRLAHAIEMLLEAGDGAGSRIRFVLGIDYDGDVVPALHLDLLVRTGVESPDVIRLSGLRSHPSAACVATTKLWCEFEPRDLDGAIAAAAERPPPASAPGYDASFVAGLVVELLREDVGSPVRLVLPVAAPRSELLAALERLQRGPLGEQRRLAVEVAPGGAGRPRRFGAEGPARQSILLLSPGRRGAVESEGPYTALLAPGQSSSVWTLADMPLGYATGHGCAPTPRGIVEGLRRALRFHVEHPPLRGAERAPPETPPQPLPKEGLGTEESREQRGAPLPKEGLGTEESSEQRGAGDPWRAPPQPPDPVAAWPPRLEELARLAAAHPHASAEEIARAVAGRGAGEAPQLVADVFVARELDSAVARGIVPEDAHWKRAALNYGYTGFAIPFRVREPSNPTGTDWEPLARHVTRFMLAVAACDEEITDRVLPGETVADRRARLVACGGYLSKALLGASAGDPPAVHGASVLAAIAADLGGIRARFAETSAPLVLDGFCRAVVDLLRANVNELSPRVVANPLVRPAIPARARVEIDRRYAGRAPDCVAAWIRALLAGEEGDVDEARRVLRLLCYLVDVAPGIGAGATFRAAALWAPAAAVTDAMARALDRTATLADYRFRLANDLSDLAGAAGRDRDAKENAWTILIPRRSSGKSREVALVRAAIACEEVASRLDRELHAALAALDALWPSMATMVRRGILVGRRFYAMGHYAELSRSDVGAILDELEDTRAEAPASGPGAEDAPFTRAA
jgi:hypothetical protein